MSTDPKFCPECSDELRADWEGDANVINGTRDILTCINCGYTTVDQDTPLAATEYMFDWARKNGLME